MIDKRTVLTRYYRKIYDHSNEVYGRHIPEYTVLMDEGIMLWKLGKNLTATLICRDGEDPIIYYHGSVLGREAINGTTKTYTTSDTFVRFLLRR